jgi:hypothetical protein
MQTIIRTYGPMLLAIIVIAAVLGILFNNSTLMNAMHTLGETDSEEVTESDVMDDYMQAKVNQTITIDTILDKDASYSIYNIFLIDGEKCAKASGKLCDTKGRYLSILQILDEDGNDVTNAYYKQTTSSNPDRIVTFTKVGYYKTKVKIIDENNVQTTQWMRITVVP